MIRRHQRARASLALSIGLIGSACGGPTTHAASPAASATARVAQTAATTLPAPLSSAPVDSTPPPETAARRARLRLGEVKVSSDLPEEVVRRIVRQRAPEFRTCYEGALARIPTLRGHVTTRFVIDRDGTVAHATNVDSDLPDPELVACITASYRDTLFPQPEAGAPVTVDASLEMSPE